MRRLFFAALLLASCKRKKPDTFTNVALEADHACAQTTSGAVFCWGGPYGDVPRVVTDRSEPLPPPPGPDAKIEGDVAGLDNVFMVARGRAHSCALRNNGTIWCWGDNSSYQLADGTRDSRDRPAMIQGVFGVQQIVAANDGTCARLGDGDVRCWGKNDSGQLGRPRGVINVPTSVRH